MVLARSLVAPLAAASVALAQYSATYNPQSLPDTTEADQYGTNNCGTANNQTSVCQDIWVNAVDDFCIWAPPTPNTGVATDEQIEVAWCTKGGRGTRLMPAGTLQQVHFVQTPDYVQVTGNGDFTKCNVAAGDAGGELDPHGPDGYGNPHGGLVFSTAFGGSNPLGQQIHEWTNFQSVSEFCIRACNPAGPNAAILCNHIYDTMGCEWNIPGDYGDGIDSCKGDDTLPMGIYPNGDGTSSTFQQGDPATPAGHPAGATSLCTTFASSIWDIAATALPYGVTPSSSVVPTTSKPAGATSSAAPHASGGSSSGAATVGGSNIGVMSVAFTAMLLGVGAIFL